MDEREGCPLVTYRNEIFAKRGDGEDIRKNYGTRAAEVVWRVPLLPFKHICLPLGALTSARDARREVAKVSRNAHVQRGFWPAAPQDALREHSGAMRIPGAADTTHSMLRAAGAGTEGLGTNMGGGSACAKNISARCPTWRHHPFSVKPPGRSGAIGRAALHDHGRTMLRAAATEFTDASGCGEVRRTGVKMAAHWKQGAGCVVQKLLVHYKYGAKFRN
ncbi:hypothetical protein K438DRAFT_2070411 [Mycena galopus ATCC 62051]|nr:hypothetical protein K438DRAFT_2070411 [Mycena galopus ATCC 62051]